MCDVHNEHHGSRCDMGYDLWSLISWFLICLVVKVTGVEGVEVP